MTTNPAKDAGWDDPPPRKGFLTDTSLCIGCKACEVACKEWNGVPDDGMTFLGSSYDNTGALGGSTWRHVAFIEQPVSGSTELAVGGTAAGPPATDVLNLAAGQALFGDLAAIGTDTTAVDLGVPAVGLPGRKDGAKRTEPPLADEQRRVQALHARRMSRRVPHRCAVRTEFGTVVVQDDICNGCGYCVPACPFGVIDKRVGDGVKNAGLAQKCTLCYDRLRDGMTPACAKACPTESIQFGDLDELRTRAALTESASSVSRALSQPGCTARVPMTVSAASEPFPVAGRAGGLRAASRPSRHHAGPAGHVAPSRYGGGDPAARCGRGLWREIMMSPTPVRRKGGAGGERRMVPPASFTSYYGRPVVKPSPWTNDIPAYLFLGGVAGGSSLLAAGADLTDRPVTRRATRAAALLAITGSFGALVHDLGKPSRFDNMLRVAKPSSPMSVGTWVLSAYAPFAGLAALAEFMPNLRRFSRPAGLAAALVAPAVASYTAVLLADTATPAWHEAYRQLPFVFVGSAAAASGGLTMAVSPLSESGPARRFALGGAALEVAMSHRMEPSMGLAAEALHQGRPVSSRLHRGR